MSHLVASVRSTPRSLLLPWLLFLVLSIGMYAEIALPGRILADYDVWTYFYPLRTYAAEAIRAGRFPLWNPDTFLGAPFFANPQTAVLYPGSVLFYVLPVPYAYSLSLILHACLAAGFMYAFLRRTLALGPVAGIIGSSAFAFGGFLSSQTGHLNQFCVSAWMPAIALAADTAVVRGSVRWAVAAGLALAVQLLAGHAQESYMTLWIVGAVFLWRVGGSLAAAWGAPSRARRLIALTRPLVRPVTMGGAIGVVGFGLAAVQLIPTAELSAHSIRSGGLSYLEAIAFSLPPPLIVRSLMPGYWFVPPDENVGYIGAVALAFAALGLLFSRRPGVLLAASLAFLGVFLAVGGANPAYPLLFEVVPGLDLFRVPARWLVVYTFGAAMLAALGTEWVTERPVQLPSVPRLIVAGVLIVGLTILALPSLAHVPGRMVVLWMGALAVGGSLALVALRWPGPSVNVVLVVIAVLELRLAAMDLPHRYPVPADETERLREVPVALLGISRPDRVLSISPVEYEVADHDELARRHPDLGPNALLELKSALKLDEIMSPNTPLRYGLATVDGYDGGVLPLRRYLTLASLLVPPHQIRTDGMLRTRLSAVPDANLLDLFGVGRVIANRITDVEREGISYDVGTPHTIPAGGQLSVAPPRPLPAVAVGMLAGQDGPEIPPGPAVGLLVIERGDGTSYETALVSGQHIFGSRGPGLERVPRPYAGGIQVGVEDTAVRVSIPPGAPVSGIAIRWDGPGSLEVRALTLEGPSGEQEQLVLQPDLQRTVLRNLKLYETRTVDLGIPLASRAEVRTDSAALEFLRAAGREERRALVILAPGSAPAPADHQPDAAAIFVREEGWPDFRERFVFRRAQGEGAGYLVVDDAWFPGWRAQVDGQDAEVYRANVHYKAVYVPRGGHTVVLRYEPDSLRLGAAISLVTLLLTAGLWIWGRAR